jgi:hypothetical protein
VDVGAIDERQPVELDREQQDQQQAGEERRQREADEGQRVGDLVEQRVRLRRRVDADRQRDQQREQLRRADDEDRRPAAAAGSGPTR